MSSNKICILQSKYSYCVEKIQNNKGTIDTPANKYSKLFIAYGKTDSRICEHKLLAI